VHFGCITGSGLPSSPFKSPCGKEGEKKNEDDGGDFALKSGALRAMQPAGSPLENKSSGAVEV